MITEEQIKKVEESWKKYGDCNSCGWHSAFYEVYSQIIPDIFNDENLEHDGSYWVPCQNDEDGDHRGSYLYDFK